MILPYMLRVYGIVYAVDWVELYFITIKNLENKLFTIYINKSPNLNLNRMHADS